MLIFALNASTKSRYGLIFDQPCTDLEIELWCIANGGKGVMTGQPWGMGLYEHYKAAMSLIWPKDDFHRWTEIGLKTIVENEITILSGCSDSGKTWLISKYALVDWWAFPDQTLWLVSSTELRGCELRIWGTVKKLFNRARDLWGEEILVGNVLEGLHCITTERISEDGSRARSLTTGLILVPCKKGRDYVGLGAYMGVKAPRLRHCGDEVSVMPPSFLDAYSNWYGKEDFKGIMACNPILTTDPGGVAACPKEGWDYWHDTGKTQTWRSKFFNAAVVAYDGRDSPNFDFPQDQPARYGYLVGKKKRDGIKLTHGENSWKYWSQFIGKHNVLMAAMQVITRQLCEEHHAREKAEWMDSKHTWIFGLDPNYGGEDRCALSILEYGMGMDGKLILKVYPVEIITVTFHRGSKPAEDQIAERVKQRAADLNVPVENIFYDATGKGTMGMAFARAFGGYQTPVAVSSGGVPTDRPVRQDYYVDDVKGKRLRLCCEEYLNFITEMWFSVREVIEGDQMRELPEDVMDELASRYYSVKGKDKVQVEPKDDLKERIGFSPDLADSLAIGIEGARQRGFRIYRLGTTPDSEPPAANEWKEDEEAWDNAIKERTLVHG